VRVIVHVVNILVGNMLKILQNTHHYYFQNTMILDVLSTEFELLIQLNVLKSGSPWLVLSFCNKL